MSQDVKVLNRPWWLPCYDADDKFQSFPYPAQACFAYWHKNGIIYYDMAGSELHYDEDAVYPVTLTEDECLEICTRIREDKGVSIENK